MIDVMEDVEARKLMIMLFALFWKERDVVDVRYKVSEFIEGLERTRIMC